MPISKIPDIPHTRQYIHSDVILWWYPAVNAVTVILNAMTFGNLNWTKEPKHLVNHTLVDPTSVSCVFSISIIFIRFIVQQICFKVGLPCKNQKKNNFFSIFRCSDFLEENFMSNSLKVLFCQNSVVLGAKIRF